MPIKILGIYFCKNNEAIQNSIEGKEDTKEDEKHQVSNVNLLTFS